MTRITRASHYRGQYVTVTWRDGTTTTGTIVAWGPQLFRLYGTSPHPGYPNDFIENASANVATVTEAVR